MVAESAINRAVLRLSVIPGSRAGKTAAELINAAVERADELQLAVVHADLRETDQVARGLFAGLGFRPARRYTEMTLDLRLAPSAESKHKNLSHRPLEPGTEAEFTELQNRVFDGSWGFCPNTTPEILQQLNAPGFSHDGVILAYIGTESAGYCWTAEILRPGHEGGTAIGRIHMMGIVPEFRGQGLGKQILRSGLDHLESKGIQTVELTTDNENLAAFSLYKRSGFKPKTDLVWYEKRIR